MYPCACCATVSLYYLEMINQLSNKYLVKKLVVYLDDVHQARMLVDLFKMIGQLSNKSLLNTFMVYLEALPFDDNGWKLQVGMIDQLSNKYLVKKLVVYLESYHQLL